MVRAVVRGRMTPTARPIFLNSPGSAFRSARWGRSGADSDIVLVGALPFAIRALGRSVRSEAAFASFLDVEIQGRRPRCLELLGWARGKEDPQYELRSGKIDHIAMHKGSALRKLNR